MMKERKIGGWPIEDRFYNLIWSQPRFAFLSHADSRGYRSAIHTKIPSVFLSSPFLSCPPICYGSLGAGGQETGKEKGKQVKESLWRFIISFLPVLWAGLEKGNDIDEALQTLLSFLPLDSSGVLCGESKDKER